MADEKPAKELPAKEPAVKPDVRRKAALPKSRAQAEFDQYRTRVAAAAAPPAGFAGPPAFSIGAGAPQGWGAGPTMMAGSPWPGEGPYGGLGLPYGALPAPPPLPPNSLTDRLRYTLRLGVDVVNATLSGGLRVLGGVSEVATWAGSMYSAGRGGYGGGHGGGCGCGCGGGDSSCGCGCSEPDPCCHSGVSSCGCGCC
jgi:hypothetical protein